ncbi:MAG: DUF559 domain-containing protein [Clostridia bacterium]|nr:DUF559 domain-containing protein [Clostridia bacterium]
MGNEIKTEQKWGFLRETREAAKKAGKDSDTGLHRTGLEDYLEVIFPDTTDWIHDKPIGNGSRRRPDYRSESLKLIIEFDGVPHYTNPEKIRQDEISTNFYQSLGYKVVRIPYFIQLTNDVVKSLFEIDVKEKLFDASIPSIGSHLPNTPAYLCHQGIIRMAKEYKNFPTQYKVNLDFMKKQEDQYLVEYELLEIEYNKL